MKILITGSTGTLGGDLVKEFAGAGHELITPKSNELNITDITDVFDFVEKNKPELIINAAAYNFVDRVEEKDIYSLAFAVNSSGPKFLAMAAEKQGIPMVHFSTDYVFDGKKDGYSEDDEPEPLSKYGETKLYGERFVRSNASKHYICRVSKLFGEPGESELSKQSFVEKMLELATDRDSLQIVDSETGCPTYTKDIARQVRALVEEEYPYGNYHIINSGGGVTWYEFALEIFDLAGIEIEVEPVSPETFKRLAERPKEAVLINTKLPELRHRREALKDFLATLN